MEWSFNGETLPVNSAVSVTQTFRSQLSIWNVQLENSGVYSCSGEDEDFNHFENEAVLKVVRKNFRLSSNMLKEIQLIALIK